MVDPSKTFDGNPCSRCGATSRWRQNGACVDCNRRRARECRSRARQDETVRERHRENVRRRRDDFMAYHTEILKNRRRAALKRVAARNAEREMV